MIDCKKYCTFNGCRQIGYPHVSAGCLDCLQQQLEKEKRKNVSLSLEVGRRGTWIHERDEEITELRERLGDEDDD